MIPALRALDLVIAGVRTIAFFTVAVFGLLCLLDWAVRKRYINPFSGLARFLRSTVDPFIAPIERRVVRAGGQPAAAPWWALAFAVIASILLVTILSFLRNQIAMAAFAMYGGPAGIYRLLLSWTIAFLRIALLVRVISSWLPVSPFAWWVRWSYGATEWMLRPLRSVVPTMGAFDITPIVAYFLVGIVGGLLMRAF